MLDDNGNGMIKISYLFGFFLLMIVLIFCDHSAHCELHATFFNFIYSKITQLHTIQINI